MKELLLYAKKPQSKDWEWELITNDESQHEKATEWAKSQGYTEFKVQETDLSVAPDFNKTIS